MAVQSTGARFLGLWVQMPPRLQMFSPCVCCVANGLCDELITHSEEFYLVCMSTCVLPRNLNSEVA